MRNKRTSVMVFRGDMASVVPRSWLILPWNFESFEAWPSGTRAVGQRGWGHKITDTLWVAWGSISDQCVCVGACEVCWTMAELRSGTDRATLSAQRDWLAAQNAWPENTGLRVSLSSEILLRYAPSGFNVEQVSENPDPVTQAMGTRDKRKAVAWLRNNMRIDTEEALSMVRELGLPGLWKGLISDRVSLARVKGVNSSRASALQRIFLNVVERVSSHGAT